MPIINYIGVNILTVNNTIGFIPQGFSECSMINTGSADATLTQNGESWTLSAGAVYQLPSTLSADAWLAISISALTTSVIVAYVGADGGKSYEALKMTTDQSTLKTVGVRVDFIAMDILMDWDDTNTEIPVSGTEMVHNYSASSTYDIVLKSVLPQNIYYIDCANSSLTSLDISKLSNLQNLYCEDNDIESLDLSANTILSTLWCDNNGMSAAAVDNIFTTLDNSGVLNGYLVITEGNDARTSNIAYNNLIAKGWIIDKPPVSTDLNTWHKTISETTFAEQIENLPAKFLTRVAQFNGTDDKIGLNSPIILAFGTEYIIQFTAKQNSLVRQNIAGGIGNFRNFIRFSTTGGGRIQLRDDGTSVVEASLNSYDTNWHNYEIYIRSNGIVTIKQDGADLIMIFDSLTLSSNYSNIGAAISAEWFDGEIGHFKIIDNNNIVIFEMSLSGQGDYEYDLSSNANHGTWAGTGPRFAYDLQGSNYPNVNGYSLWQSNDIARSLVINSGAPTIIDNDTISCVNNTVTDLVRSDNYWVLGKKYKINVTVTNYTGVGTGLLAPYDGVIPSQILTANGTYEMEYIPAGGATNVYFGCYLNVGATIHINYIKLADDIQVPKDINGNEAVYSAEKVVNGGFDTDTDWVKGTGWTISGGRADSSGIQYESLEQAGVLIVGRFYKITLTASASINFLFHSASFSGTSTERKILEGTNDYYLTASGSLLGLYQAGTDNIWVDNVSVKEIVIPSGYTWTRDIAPGGTKWNMQDALVDIENDVTLQCDTAGIAYVESTDAYGLVFDGTINIGNLNTDIIFISGNIAGDINNYWFRFKASDNNILYFLKESTTLFGTSSLYYQINTNYRILTWRNSTINEFITGSIGTFVMYIQGKNKPITKTIYLIPNLAEMELIDVTSGLGTNPITDNTHTISSYFVSRLFVGDQIKNIQINSRPVSPYEFTVSTGAYSKIDNPANEIFNRLNATIQTAISRAADDYDATHPFRYNVKNIADPRIYDAFFEALWKDMVFGKVALAANNDIIRWDEELNYATAKSGAELIQNGDFSDGSTGWILGTGWTISGGLASIINVKDQQITTSAPTITGKTYRAVLDISTISSGSFRIYLKGGGDARFVGDSYSSSGIHIFTFIAESNNDNIAIYPFDFTTGDINSVSVKEVTEEMAKVLDYCKIEDIY